MEPRRVSPTNANHVTRDVWAVQMEATTIVLHARRILRAHYISSMGRLTAVRRVPTDNTPQIVIRVYSAHSLVLTARTPKQIV